MSLLWRLRLTCRLVRDAWASGFPIEKELDEFDGPDGFVVHREVSRYWRIPYRRHDEQVW